jgi:hypothetical protein
MAVTATFLSLTPLLANMLVLGLVFMSKCYGKGLTITITLNPTITLTLTLVGVKNVSNNFSKGNDKFNSRLIFDPIAVTG